MTDSADPRWCVHPGWLIKEALNEMRLPQSWLASEAGLTQKHVSRVITGRAGIGPHAAVAVGRALNISPHLLGRMQSDYDIGRVLGLPDVDREAS